MVMEELCVLLTDLKMSCAEILQHSMIKLQSLNDALKNLKVIKENISVKQRHVNQHQKNLLAQTRLNNNEQAVLHHNKICFFYLHDIVHVRIFSFPITG